MATPRERKFAFSYVERGKELAAAKHYPEALEALREAVRRDPTLVEAWILLALTHYRLHEYIECLGAADEALKHDSATRAGWNVRGQALLALGRPAEAFAQFSYAAGQWPHPYLAANAGVALHDLRRHDGALAWTDNALTRDPLHSLAMVNRAHFLIYLERYEEAKTQLAGASAVASNQSNFWAAKGSLLTRNGDYDKAMLALKRAIDLSDEDSDGVAWECMGKLLIALEDYQNALEFAEHGLALWPYDSWFQELKAKALRGLGRVSEADEIERAVQARLAEQLALLDQAEGANG
ncbi:MAG TPA: tetratricopeptide repeat protein [Ktedonobacterales bacterium]|jgi:tetratricopeptide (TPR) repeat protein